MTGYVSVRRCGVRVTTRAATAIFGALLFGAAMLSPQQFSGQQVPNPFPSGEWMLSRIAQRQEDIQSQFKTYLFKDDSTVYTLDKKGQLRHQRAETCYLSPSERKLFALHLGDNQKPTEILFTDILGKSRLTPLRWESGKEQRVIVYAFEPKSLLKDHGNLASRIAGNLKGTVWVSPADGGIVRMEFQSVSAPSRRFLGSVNALDGFVEMHRTEHGVWLPVHQEFVVQGKNVVIFVTGIRYTRGFRIRRVDELSEYLKIPSDKGRPSSP